MRLRRSRVILGLGLVLLLGLVVLYLLYDYGVFAEADRSILTDEPCAAPCWQGIIPSHTTEEEAIRILQNNPFVSRHGVHCHHTDPRSTICRWTAKHWRGGVNRLYTWDGVVYLMYLTPEINFTLGQVVGKYGPPEKVYTDIGGIEELVYCFHLYYPSRGLAFISLTPIDPGKRKASVSEDWTVNSIDYFAPTSLKGYFEVLIPDLPDSRARALREVEDWQGFGIYDFGSD